MHQKTKAGAIFCCLFPRTQIILSTWPMMPRLFYIQNIESTANPVHREQQKTDNKPDPGLTAGILFFYRTEPIMKADCRLFAQGKQQIITWVYQSRLVIRNLVRKTIYKQTDRDPVHASQMNQKTENTFLTEVRYGHTEDRNA